VSTFAYFFSYTPEAWARLVAEPGDRTPAVRATVADAGGELTALYYTMGELGGLAIAEAPDPETASAIGLVITSSGAFESVRIQQLVTAADFVGALSRAQQASPGYRRPGE
jgi:uncharacterized protein with GYD domain